MSADHLLHKDHGAGAAASDRSIFNSNYSAESCLKMQSNALNYMLNFITMYH